MSDSGEFFGISEAERGTGRGQGWAAALFNKVFSQDLREPVTSVQARLEAESKLIRYLEGDNFRKTGHLATALGARGQEGRSQVTTGQAVTRTPALLSERWKLFLRV